MIARNKRPVRTAGRSTSGRLSQNRRKIVPVHDSYRAELRAGAFHPVCVARLPVADTGDPDFATNALQQAAAYKVGDGGRDGVLNATGGCRDQLQGWEAAAIALHH